MINEAVRRQAPRYFSEFANARPFPHVVIYEFFESSQAEQLLADFPPFDPANARNEFGAVGRKAAVPDIRKISPFYAEVYRYVASREFLDFTSQVTGISDLIFDEQMFGGGTHENLEGQNLDPHVDFNYLEDRKLHRRLNLLLYLNKEWQQTWGGCLELHSNPRRPRENQIKVIAPVFNRCVIFETSERSWHGFETIALPESKKHLSRKMLSIYLYTRDRPAEEIAPPHATFYVQRPLPPYLVPGYTLTDDDLRQIEDLFVRRDTWIEHYQKQELNYSRRIHELTHAEHEERPARPPLQRIRSWFPAGKVPEASIPPPPAGQPAPQPIVNVPVSGYAVQEGDVQGAWPDGWIGSPFAVTIRLQKKPAAIVVEGYLPEQLHDDAEISVSLNDSPVLQRRVARGDFSLRVCPKTEAGDVVKLGITSSQIYCPQREGASADDRELAMVLKTIRLISAY